MKIILKSDLENLGQYGDIKIVANGYARNYLLPRNLAVPLTEGRAKEISLIQAQADQVKKARQKEMADQIKKLAGLTLEISAKARKDKLFGSITAKNIAEKLAAKNFNLKAENIKLEQPIKKIGQYQVPVELSDNLKETIKIIIKDEEEKEK